MGKKSQNDKSEKQKTFVLKVAMHCQCEGCANKIRNGIKQLSLVEGVAQLEPAAAKGEVKVVATADPEKLRRRLQKATDKSVELVLPKEPPRPQNAAEQAPHVAAASHHQDAWMNQAGWRYDPGTAAAPQVIARPYPWAQPETYSYPWGYLQGTYGVWHPQGY